MNDKMEKRRKDSLNSAFPKIISSLKLADVREICNSLRVAEVLTEEQYEEISRLPTAKERSQTLLAKVHSGNDLSYDKFRAALLLRPMNFWVKEDLLKLLPHYQNEVAIYDLVDKGKTGIVLIVNNFKFEHFNERKVSHKDEKNVKRMWKKLNFDIYKDGKTNNLTKTDMETEIENFAKLSDHKKYSCSVVIVMTHGDEGILFAKDTELNKPETNEKEETARRDSTVAELQEGKVDNNSKNSEFSNVVDVNWITEQFLAKNAPHLKGKPKLFFFQACRGTERDTGVDAAEKHKTDVPVSHNRIRTANHSDFLIVCSTVANYVSYRNMYGSWLIQTVVEVFERLSAYHDILSMLTEVIRETQKRSTTDVNGYKMVPEFRSTLTKKLYFQPYFSQHK